jgi:hypothetical protein
MAIPKVFQVLKAMKSDEIAALEELVTAQKRASLKKLFKLIGKTDTEKLDKLDKELAYMQVFGKKYSPENDYLWRNELRLLMDLIEGYAAGKMIEEEMNSMPLVRSKYFLKYLLSKNMYHLVDGESNRIKEAAIKEYDYDTVTEVCSIISPYLNNYSWNSIEVQEKMEANYKLYQQSVCKQFLHNYRRAQIAIYGSKLFKYKENFKVVIPEPGIEQYFKEYEDAFSKFYELRLQTIALPEAIDPAIYAQCLEHLDKYPDIPNAEREKFMLLNNLSGYYFFHYDYERAFEYNNQSIALVDKIDKVYAIAATYNYVSNLAHLSRYDEALEAIKKYDNLIALFPNQIERFQYLEACCYALKGDKKAFNDSLPRQFDELSKMMQYHYRFLIALSHFLDKEYQLAITEVKNIERSIKSLKSDKLNYYDGLMYAAEHIDLFFETYEEYMLNGDKEKLKRNLDMLDDKIKFFKENQPMAAGLLFYGWMRNQIEKLKTKLS